MRPGRCVSRARRRGTGRDRALAEGGGHIQRATLADQHGAVHHRRHFADVARPLVLRQPLHVIVGDRHGAKTEPVRGPLGEVLGKRADVAGTIAKRRNDDRKHREAIVEILAKGLLLDHAGQIAMRGRDDSHVDADRALSADAHHLGVLDDAQQTHLRGRSELADFVEEQRAAIGLLEPALAAAHGAREGALFVAEELRVDELGGDRAAVDAAERAVPETASARGSRGR